ncbi:MAG: putative ATP-dependent endonuclease of the family, partial [Thermoleophilaceae bacterium]|nr:putative ATP-dependent endonuclease of the family [Thermoleophilaceae bacterium]
SVGVVVSVSIELRGYDDDDDAKAVLSTCTTQYDPYVARLTYRYFPRAEVAIVVNDAEAEVRVDSIDRPLTVADYDFIVYGGQDETNDVRRVRRDIALRVLHALRDAETDLQSWRRNPLRDLLERLPLDSANLNATALAVAAAVDQLRLDPNVGAMETHLATRLHAMTGPRLPLTPTLGFASTEPDELVRAVRLFIDQARRHQVADASLGGANVLYLGLLLEALAQQRAQDEFVTTILAVEEPEAHLHVSLQRRLFRHLLRSEPTLLLTTHSPHIAAVTPLRSLVVLRESAAGTMGRTTAGVEVTPRQEHDLERYLDVSRAELLFSSTVILVEGLAELYLVPALASAAGFDLDSYGVVVASVHGTDFRPYVTLLGPGGLDASWTVITDGDPDAPTTARREAGLRRAVAVLPQGEDRSRLVQAIRGIATSSSADNRMAIVDELGQHGLFVGQQTLELDLCSILGDQMIAAFNELPTTIPAREDLKAGVANERSRTPQAAARAAMLRRIEAVGKGRYAQRLAAHVADDDLTALVEESGGDPTTEPIEAGPASYLLNALDRVSRIVRGRPLFAEVAPDPDG